LIVALGDFSWINEDFLQEHWEVYQKFEDCTVAAAYADVPTPPLKDNIQVDDISIFKEKFDATRFLSQPVVHPDDRRSVVQTWIDARRGFISENWIMGLISLPRDKLIRLNGYDTIFNGGKGGSDYNLNFRAERMGHRFLYSRNAMVVRCAHPHQKLKPPFTEKPHIRPRAANKQIERNIQQEIHKNFRTLDGHIGLQDRRWKNSRTILINGGGATSWVMESIKPLLNHNLRVSLFEGFSDQNITDYVTYGCSIGDVELTMPLLDSTQCWFWWSGSDVLALKNSQFGIPASHEFFHHRNLHHLCVHKRLQDELNYMGIESQIILDVPDDFEDAIPYLPEKCRILSYVPSSRPEFYGLPSIIDVAERLPDIQFMIYGNRKPFKDLPDNIQQLGWIAGGTKRRIYERTSIFLRPSQHEGIPYAMIELVRMGRRCITNYPYEGVHLAQTETAIVKKIEELQDIQTPDFEMSRRYRELYNTEQYYKDFVGIFYGVEANDAE
jgi:glycosyltransferase involved in cell wall biosynthesis